MFFFMSRFQVISCRVAPRRRPAWRWMSTSNCEPRARHRPLRRHGSLSGSYQGTWDTSIFLDMFSHFPCIYPESHVYMWFRGLVTLTVMNTARSSWSSGLENHQYVLVSIKSKRINYTWVLFYHRSNVKNKYSSWNPCLVLILTT